MSGLGALVCALVLLASVSLAGCSASADDASVAASSAEVTLQQIAAADDATVSDMLSSVQFYSQDYGVSSAVFAQACYEGMVYRVGEASVSGDEAQVEVSVTVPVAADVLTTLKQARDAALANGEDALRDGYADAAFKDIMSQTEWDFETLSASVSLVRGDDGSWELADKATLAAVLLDGFDPRQAGE